MKKMFRNSSGLLELVLVGLIIAILFIIVVPTILERISTSKKNGYIDMVKMYVEAARMDNPYELNQAIMISFEQLEPFLESGGSSSPMEMSGIRNILLLLLSMKEQLTIVANILIM